MKAYLRFPLNEINFYESGIKSKMKVIRSQNRLCHIFNQDNVNRESILYLLSLETVLEKTNAVNSILRFYACDQVCY